MTLIEHLKTVFSGDVPRTATIRELSDHFQLNVRGRKNERITTRLRDSSRNALSFRDDGFVWALEFTIASHRESMDIDFAKPSQGEYLFEVSTPAGRLLDYRTD